MAADSPSKKGKKPTRATRARSSKGGAPTAADLLAHDNPLERLAEPHDLHPDADEPKDGRRRRRRRQWGTEKNRDPLPAVQKQPRTIATWLGGFALVATVVAFATYLAATIVSQFIDDGIRSSAYAWQSLGYVLVMAALIFSTFCYLLAR